MKQVFAGSGAAAAQGVAPAARAPPAVQKEIARPRIPAQYRAIVTSLSASRLPPVHPAQYGCRPCSLHSAVSCSAITALPGSGCHRPGGSAPFLPRPHPCAPRPCVCRCHRASCAATSDRLPARPRPVLSGQRLGTDAGNALLGGSAAGLFMIPVVIRCRFRSTVAVPIPFTRVKSSPRRKWPCCRRYATIASAFMGPTFANPCCSVDASAVLMLIRSAAKAIPLNSSPSTSALHENQGPTVQLLVARNRPLPAILSKVPASLATYTQPIVHGTFTQQA